VLAGGASRRLGGSPKGLEVVGESRIVDRVASALKPVSDELVLIANVAEADQWLTGVTVIRDLHAGAGGLAGVEAALTRGRDALVVAWDMPFVTTRLLAALVELAHRADAAITLPESESPFGYEPLCAYYSIRLREALRVFLDAGGGAAHDFIARTQDVHTLPISAVRGFGDPRQLFFSVNTPDDLVRARAIATSTK
jgi:molybdopterin-guanine dinucleotide biosynthesis protein A